MRHNFRTVGLLTFSFLSLMELSYAQARQATITGGGGPDRGQCRVEVVVDGAAEVEIRGASATLRDLSGQQPQWRRFECSSAIPANPLNLRFDGVEGRGRQELVRTPQNGGSTLVRIQDPSGGAATYVFDVIWGVNDRRQISPPPPIRGGTRFTTEQAIRVCQDAIRQQAYDRYRSASIAFRETKLDNNPGRQDWITGLFDMRRGFDRDETFEFSCSVNFDNGQVRSAQMNPIERDRYMPGYGDARTSPTRIAMDSCERAVENNINNRGYQHVDFLSIRVDDRPGRGDWIVGDARADIRSRSDSFSFSCSVDLRDGDVRTVDVRRR